MIGENVYDQLSYLTSNERRILRNFQEGSGNSRGSSFQTRLARIAQPIGSTGEGAKGSANRARIYNLLAAIRNGDTASVMKFTG